MKRLISLIGLQSLLTIAGWSQYSGLPPFNFSGAGGGSSALVLLGNYPASASSEVDMTTRNAAGQTGNVFQTDFDLYFVAFQDIVFSAPGSVTSFEMKFHDSGSYDTGSHYYTSQFAWSAGGTAAGGVGQTTSIQLSPLNGRTVSSTSTFAGNGEFYIHEMNNARYEIRITGLQPATNASSILFQAHTSGGGYDTGSNYSWVRNLAVSSGIGANGSNSDTSMQLYVSQSSTTTYSVAGTVKLSDPQGSEYKMLSGVMTGFDTLDAALGISVISGMYKSATAMDGFRIKASSGNLQLGTVRCYGVAK